MKTEFEASFANINKEEIRKKLSELGGSLKNHEYLQKRCVFHLPEGHEIKNGWLRVREEADKITLSLKVVANNLNIEGQKELELKVDDFESACELLETIGCKNKAYQENLREKWEIDGVEVTIDEWPYLEPYIEVEGDSESIVKSVAEKLGFNYSEAYFGAVDGMYAEKYNITEDRINNHTPKILFNMEKNPFLD